MVIPVQPPSYGVPAWNPDGSTDMNAAMSNWVNQFGQQYREGQEGLQRLPYIVSTFSNTSQATGGQYVGKEVDLQGGEQVQVSGYGTLQVADSSNSAGLSLRITYPGGTTQRKLNQVAELAAWSEIEALGGTTGNPNLNGQSTVRVRATVGYTWPVEARFQTGGAHRFDLMTSGAGSIKNGTISILVM